MGQAILDLPDPTQLSGSPAGPLSPQALASADDLLSQLAGDDIDRLLAEADAEKPQAAQPISPPFDQPPDVAESQVVTTPPEPTAAAEPPAAEPTIVDILKPADAATEAAIDAILAPAIEETLKEVDAQLAQAAPTVEALVAAHPVIDPPSAPPAPQVAPAATAIQNETALVEAAATVSAIMDPPPPPEPEPLPVPVASVADAAERQALSEPLILPPTPASRSRGVQLLVRFLQLINYPALLLSDEVREAMGKIAILTTFNAIAVIIYVMVFRRPHH